MKELILSVLNSQYRDWIMFSIPFILTAIGMVYKCIKTNIDKRRNQKNKRKLPWVGRIDGIDKNNKGNMQL